MKQIGITGKPIYSKTEAQWEASHAVLFEIHFNKTKSMQNEAKEKGKSFKTENGKYFLEIMKYNKKEEE